MTLTRNVTWLHAAALTLFVTWFVPLGERRLLDPDEARYAEIAREMLVSGDWVTPRLNDLKYFEKPPLQYWMTALAFRMVGVNEFAARLWCAFTGVLGIVAAYGLAARLFGRDAGIASAAVLAGSLLYAVMGHINTLDMGLTVFLQLALSAFLLAQCTHAVRSQRIWMATAWSMAALAVLSKGPVAVVLPALTLVVYSLLHRDLTVWRRLHFGIGLPLFAVITLPWFILVSRRNPEFLEFFFVHEHWQRYLTDVAQRVEPWWYFAPLLCVGLLPWTTLAPAAWLRAWQCERDDLQSRGFRVRRFLLIWLIVVFVFFSASHSKLPPYILPLWPAAAILIGEYCVRAPHTTLRRHLIGAGVLWLLIGAYTAVGPVPPRPGTPPNFMESARQAIALAAAMAAIGAGVGAYWLRADRARLGIVGTAVGVSMAVMLLQQDFALTRHLRSEYDLAQVIRKHHDAHKPFYSIAAYRHSLSFYLQRPITLVGYRGELDFGQTLEPERALPNLESFVAAWSRDPSGSIAVLPPSTLTELTSQRIPLQVIGRDARLVAVKKP